MEVFFTKTMKALAGETREALVIGPMSLVKIYDRRLTKNEFQQPVAVDPMDTREGTLVYEASDPILSAVRHGEGPWVEVPDDVALSLEIRDYVSGTTIVEPVPVLHPAGEEVEASPTEDSSGGRT